MRSFHVHAVAVLCAPLLICTAGNCRAATDAARDPHWAVLVDKNVNLYQVTPTFYRSAQFNKTQIAELEKLGIRTSIDLRKFHSDSGELKGSSIKEVRVSTNTWSIGDKTIIAALTAIRRAEAIGPVLLHCQHGSDRTGLVTAMYRIVFQGWTKDAALDELLHGGFGYHSIWKNIPEYVKNADVEKIKNAVDKELVKQDASTRREDALPRTSAQSKLWRRSP
jgi:protein tyrosine/serine phosphatase